MFDNLSEENRYKLLSKLGDINDEKCIAILERIFGQPTKFSDIKEEDIDKLEEAIGQIEDVLN